MTVVRTAERADVETLLEIQRAASLAALGEIFPPDVYPFPDGEVRERWREAVTDQERRVLVAERDGRALGVVAVAPRSLDALYVVPDAWGSGVGSRLHDAALGELATFGPDAHLWVLERNRDARRFYERRGWRRDGSAQIVPFPPHPIEIGYARSLR